MRPAFPRRTSMMFYVSALEQEMKASSLMDVSRSFLTGRIPDLSQLEIRYLDPFQNSSVKKLGIYFLVTNHSHLNNIDYTRQALFITTPFSTRPVTRQKIYIS